MNKKKGREQKNQAFPETPGVQTNQLRNSKKVRGFAKCKGEQREENNNRLPFQWGSKGEG